MAASGSSDDARPEDSRGEDDLIPHPADAIYADGPSTAELDLAEVEIEETAPAAETATPSGPSAPGAPDPAEAAEPDEVIREPDDIEPDTADGESGHARRVDPAGRTRPLQTAGERPSPKE